MENLKTIKQNQLVLLQVRLAQGGLLIKLSVKDKYRIVKVYQEILPNIQANVRLAQRFTNLQKLLTHMNSQQNCQCNVEQGHIRILQNFFQVGKIQLKEVQISPDFEINRMIEKCQSVFQDISHQQMRIMLRILAGQILQLKTQQKNHKSQIQQVKKQKSLQKNIKQQMILPRKTDPQIRNKALNIQMQKVQKKHQKPSQIKQQMQQIVDKRFNEQLKIIQSEINSQFEKLSQKFQKHFKFLYSKIQDSVYQTQKKLYQKFSYLFKQINNDIDVINSQQIQINRNTLYAAGKEGKQWKQENQRRQSLSFDMIVGNVKLGQRQLQNFPLQQKIQQKKQMYQAQNLRTSQRKVPNSFSLLKKKRPSFRYSIRNEKMTVKNEFMQPQIFPIYQSIKTEQFKQTCRIKIEQFRDEIAIGIIDHKFIELPINQIGKRFVYYQNNGKVWNGLVMLENQGIGFQPGETVEFIFDAINKTVEWKVNNSQRYKIQYQNLNLSDSWTPFVYFFNKDDSVSVMPI